MVTLSNSGQTQTKQQEASTTILARFSGVSVTDRYFVRKKYKRYTNQGFTLNYFFALFYLIINDLRVCVFCFVLFLNVHQSFYMFEPTPLFFLFLANLQIPATFPR